MRRVEGTKEGITTARTWRIIDGLVRSIEAVGIMHPGLLIAGERRLVALPEVGMAGGSPDRGRPLSKWLAANWLKIWTGKTSCPSEIDAIRKALAPMKEAAERRPQGGETFHTFRSRQTRRNLGSPSSLAGPSGRTIEKIGIMWLCVPLGANRHNDCFGG
jgi:hypothetical protein